LRLLAAACVSAAAATVFPLDVVVFGVLAFGVLHLSLEVRWVVGRFRHLLRGRLLVAVSAVLGCIVLVRLVVPSDPGRRIEVGLLVGALAVAAWWPDPDDDSKAHRASWDRAGWDLTLVLCGAGLVAVTGLYATFGAIP